MNEKLGEHYSRVDLASLQSWIEKTIGHTVPPEDICETLQTVLNDFSETRCKIERGEREWRDVFDAVLDPIFLHDKEYRIIRANRAYARKAGMDIRDVIGRHYWRIFPKGDGPLSQCRSIVEQKSHAHTEEVTFDSGESYLSRCFALYSEQGEYLYSVHIMEDVTARKKAEQQLRDASDRLSLSLELLKVIVEAVPIRVFWKGRDSRYLGCNTLFAKDAGLSSPDGLIGRTDFDMGWKDQAELYRADDRRVMESGIPRLGYEEPQTTPDGKTIWLRTSKVPLRNDRQEVFGVLGIYDDITRQRETEKNLLLSESRLKEAQSVARLGSWELDLVKNELWWSDENYRVFGVEPSAKNTYETFLATVHPDDKEYVDRIYTSSVKNKTPYDIEHRLLMADGSVKWVNERCKTYYDDDGTPLRSVGTTLNITDRKKAQTALAESESRLKAVFDSVPTGIVIIDAESRRFVDANPAAVKMIGASLKDIIGQNCHRFMCAAQKGMCPVIDLRESVENKECILRTAPGEQRTIIKTVAKTLLSGRLHLVESFIDITEHKRAEAQVTRLGRLLDTSINEIYIFDAKNLKFIQVNEGARRNLGYSMEELANLTPLDLKPEFTPELFKTLLEPLRNDESSVKVFETVHRRKDGSLYPVEVHLQFSGKEQPPMFIAIILDITERRKAEEQLRHSEAALAEAQRIAHLGSWEFDLNTNVLVWSAEIYRIFEIDSERFGASYEAFLNAVHPEDRELVDQSYRNSVRDRSPYSIVHRLLMNDGRIKYVREMCETYYDEQGRPRRSLGTVQDITAQYLAERSLYRSNRALRALTACNNILVHASDENQLLIDMCHALVDRAGYRLAWIGIPEHDENKRVRPVAYAGFENGYLESVAISWADDEHGQGPTGMAVRSGTPQIAQDIDTDPRFALWRKQALSHGYAASIAVPLKNADGKVFAVLNIYAAERNAFDDEEIELLNEMAGDIAFGVLALRTRKERDHFHLANLESAERHKATLVDTIRAITLTVEKRDPYTAGHQNRVAQLAVAIAQEMNLDADRIEGLKLGTMIHDMGKIYVPAEILNRPGRLAIEEFELIKTHPAVGHDIIKDVKFPWPVATMVLQHHERLDGSGYPHGLKGDAIILEARILAVADVVEAITAHRPYRPALGMDKALREIEMNRGRLYDPEAVDICLRLIREKGFAFNATGQI